PAGLVASSSFSRSGLAAARRYRPAHRSPSFNILRNVRSASARSVPWQSAVSLGSYSLDLFLINLAVTPVVSSVYPPIGHPADRTASASSSSVRSSCSLIARLPFRSPRVPSLMVAPAEQPSAGHAIAQVRGYRVSQARPRTNPWALRLAIALRGSTLSLC